MVTPNTQKIIVIVIILFVLAFFGYSLFKSTPANTTNPASASPEVPGQDILTLVEKLKNISINQTIFSSNLFVSLTDYSTALSPEQQGRDNPFAPIGSDLSGPTSQSNTRQATSTRGQ